MLAPAQRDTIIATLCEAIPQIKAIYLFGSRAGTGEHAIPESDYDIGFYASHLPSISPYETLLLASNLAAKLHAPSVDLIDAGAVPDHYLQTQVIDGDRIWCDGTPEVLLWEAKALTMANDFFLSNEELRQHDLRVIRERHAARNHPPQIGES